MPVDVLAAIDEGTLVVTATRRLARRLRLDFAARARRKGQRAWRTPDVIPWPEWLDRLWTTLDEQESNEERRRTLNPVQETALWAKVVGEATREYPLLATSDAAASARVAWQFINEWQIPLGALGDFGSAETLAFRAWLERYLDRCREGRWLDRPRLAGHFVAQVGVLAPKLRRGVCLAGFDELTPGQNALVRALREAGCPVTRWMPSIQAMDRSRCGLPREEEEIAAAARWARRMLERDPAATVGIVIPDLTRLRSRVQRILDDVLTPNAVLPGATPYHPVYNLSLGLRLIDYPPVLTALLILDLAGGSIPYEDWSYLLRSPFLGGARKEAAERALLDAELRGGGERSWTLSRLSAILNRDGGRGSNCPALRACMLGLSTAVSELPGTALPSRWSRLYQRWLQAAGWPGGGPLESREYQTVQQLNAVLIQLSRLDPITGSQTFSEALALFRRITADAIFQPEGEDLPLVVLGTLEAAGLTFDHLWVMGLHDRAWPPPPRPNPLLPLEVQRRYGLPHSSAERERVFSGRILERLLSSARHVVVSWPRQREEEILRPSPLIRVVEPVETVASTDPPFYRETVFAARMLERLDGDTGPPLGQDVPRGGVAILKEQSACPFRAFALFRLGSEPLPRPVLGIDPLTRGRLLHEVLERLWGHLGTQANLLTLPDAELQDLLDTLIRKVMARLQSRRGPAWRTLLQIERELLAGRLRELMEKEKQRAPFSVEEREFTRVSEIGGLRLSMRIDRVDRLEGGGRAVIDYKTGQASVNGWFGKRPDEPQLPLYAVTDPRRLEGLVFASMTAESVAFRGIARRANQFPGVPAYEHSPHHRRHGDWESLLASWRVRLEDIAATFAAGEAVVDPKRREICTYCHLHALCRIDEIRGTPRPGDE